MRRAALIGRVIAVVVLVAGVAAAWRWRGLFDPAVMTRLLGGSASAPLAFLALHIAASLFFVPRTLLALGAGLIFGLWWGILWAALGSLAGAVAGFLAARYVRAGFVDRADPARLAALLGRTAQGGWRLVAIVRLVPIIPHSLANYALGLTGVRLGAYALGSLLGQLPLTIAYAGLGDAGAQALAAGADWRRHMLWPSLVGLGALALSLGIPLIARRRERQAAPVSGALPEA